LLSGVAHADPRFGKQLPANAQFSTKVPANIKAIAVKTTDLRAAPGQRLKVTGVSQAANLPSGDWNLRVTLGKSGPGQKIQAIVIKNTGKIIDKAPVQVEPKHTGTNSDL
jgi:hypothetical protein